MVQTARDALDVAALERHSVVCFHKVFHRFCEDPVTRPWGCDLKPVSMPALRPIVAGRRPTDPLPHPFLCLNSRISLLRRKVRPLTRKDGRLVVPDDADHPLHRGGRHRPRHLAGVGARLRCGSREGLRRQAPIVWFEVLAGEKATRHGTASGCRTTRSRPSAVPGRDQGTADDAGRRRHPEPQRDAAPGARPLRLRAAGALLHGRPSPVKHPERHERGHLPREHRGRLRRDRVGARQPQAEKLIEFLSESWASRSGPTRASASSRSPSPAPSGWCAWRSATPSRTAATA